MTRHHGRQAARFASFIILTFLLLAPARPAQAAPVTQIRGRAEILRAGEVSFPQGSDPASDQRRSRGVFQFEPSILIEDDPVERECRILAVGARVQSGAGYYEPVRVPLLLLFRKDDWREAGRTLVEIRHVELRLRERTIALLSPATRLASSTIAEDSWPVEAGHAMADRSSLEVLYHVRLRLDDSQASPIPDLGDAEFRTISWKPASRLLLLKPALEPGRPPEPGRLAAAGEMSAFPPRPAVGEPFEAVLYVRNDGELPTARAAALWSYGSVSTETEIPALAPGATAILRFRAEAEADADRVTLDWPGARHVADVLPVKTARPDLVGVEVQEAPAEDPLELILFIANRGSAAAGALTLRLAAEGRDTRFALPPVPAGETRAVAVSWAESLPVRLVLEAVLLDGERVETSFARIVERRPRPRARLAIRELRFEVPEAVPGAPGRLVLVAENRGDLEGSAAVSMKVLQESTGRILATRTATIRLNAGGAADVATEFFALKPGLLRGDVLFGTKADFTLLDVPPAGVDIPAGRVRIDATPVGAEADGAVKIRPNTYYVFAPVEQVEEVDTVVTLVVRSTTWSAARSARPVAALRARLSGSGWSDRFEIASVETTFTVSLTRSSLAETVTLELDPAGSSSVGLPFAPYLVVLPAAAENAVLGDVAAAETGVYATIRNRGRLIRSETTTVSLAYAGEEPVLHAVPVEPGSSRRAFFPTPPRAAGRQSLVIALPFSLDPLPLALRRFVTPRPLPRLALVGPLEGRVGRNGTGVLALCGVSGGEAPDLALAIDRAGRPPREVGPVPLVPAAETAVFLGPRADTVRLDYGPVSFAAPVTRGESLPVPRLRIIDLGDDSPVAGGDIVLRFERRARGESLPEALVYVAVNGLLRASMRVPALERNRRHFAGFRMPPGPDRKLAITLFEPVGGGEAPASLSSAVSFVAETFVALLAEADPATGRGGVNRADREWTEPVLHGTVTLPDDPFERLAFVSWEAARRIAAGGLAAVPPITPKNARDLASLREDTSSIGRIAFRESLAALVEEWTLAGRLLAGGRLPVTVEAAHLAGFFDAIEKLRLISDAPVAVDRASIERSIAILAERAALLVGVTVDARLLD